MKKFRHIFLLLAFSFLGFTLSAQSPSLIGKLEEYVSAIKHTSLESQKQETDFLIETCTDTLIQKEVALWLYDYYAKSPIMGFEAVAIHIYDNWFANKKVALDEASLLGAKIFAEFNRQSLLGCKAPELHMEDINGVAKVLFASSSKGQDSSNSSDSSSKYYILYFYSSSCPKCELETLLLSRFMQKKGSNLFLYAVYMGDNKEAWKSYVEEKFFKFNLNSEGDLGSDLYCQIEHYWDPNFDSDYQRKYGVLESPKMFLVDAQGIIVGRGLDTSALEELLKQLEARENYNYGSEASTEFYNKYFSSFGKVLSSKDILDFAHSIEKQTLPNNVQAYKQLMGDLLYYLVGQHGEQYKLALGEIAQKWILTRDDIWTTEADSLKVVGMAKIMSELVSMPPYGSKIKAPKLRGTLLKNGKARNVTRYLHRLRGKENYILFYTEGCKICDKEKEAAKSLSKAHGIQVFMVNLDKLIEDKPELADLLLESFDLSSLPFIIQTNRKGIILRKYLSLIPIL